MLTITYEKLLEIYFQNPQFGYYFLVLTSQRLLENISRLEAIVAQNKPAQGNFATLRQKSSPMHGRNRSDRARRSGGGTASAVSEIPLVHPIAAVAAGISRHPRPIDGFAVRPARKTSGCDSGSETSVRARSGASWRLPSPNE